MSGAMDDIGVYVSDDDVIASSFLLLLDNNEVELPDLIIVAA